jgi:hypothetical protein
MTGPLVTVSTRAHASRLAARGKPFDASALMEASGCSSSTAQTVLGKMAAAGDLSRVAHGWYAAPGVMPKHTPKPGGAVAMARGENEERARELAAAEAWLAEKPKLPPARPPVFRERGSRRSA